MSYQGQDSSNYQHIDIGAEYLTFSVQHLQITLLVKNCSDFIYINEMLFQEVELTVIMNECIEC